MRSRRFFAVSQVARSMDIAGGTPRDDEPRLLHHTSLMPSLGTDKIDERGKG